MIEPTHATSDMAYALSRLGHDRLSYSAYRMASLFPSQSSSSIESKYPGPVLGSDFPVEPPDPFRGMYAAVTRLNPATGTSPDGDMGWYPEEALSIEQALLGFTRNAAYGWFKEDLMGAIEVGKLADFVVVDKDVLGGEGKELRDVVVRETWVGGKRVHPLDLEEVTARWQGMVWEQTQRFIDAGMRYVIGDIRE
jgi:predicted amidohydrolase YtcJ